MFRSQNTKCRRFRKRSSSLTSFRLLDSNIRQEVDFSEPFPPSLPAPRPRTPCDFTLDRQIRLTQGRMALRQRSVRGLEPLTRPKKNKTKKDKIILYIQYVRFYIDTLNGTVTPRVQREERRTEREFLLRWWWWWCVLLRSLQKTKQKEKISSKFFFFSFFIFIFLSELDSTRQQLWSQ